MNTIGTKKSSEASAMSMASKSFTIHLAIEPTLRCCLSRGWYAVGWPG